MELYFAPLEGITGREYRLAHQRWFGGVDKYYAPFISPTQDHIFTPKEKRNVFPEFNPGVPLVPQLLTKNPDDFTWAADELFAMGYDEVNLNLGCPSGTVVAKGKGAGLLADPENLNEFLYQIYRKATGPISLKTRLGLTDPEEFHRILNIFSRYPVPLLIIHPRVRQDYYKHPIRMEYFEQAMRDYPGALCYNGGIFTTADGEKFTKSHPGVDKIMLGQGLLADPALALKLRGEGRLEREKLRGFHDELYHNYLENFKSEKNTVFHMKELWQFLARSFEGGEKLFKQIRKAENSAKYDAAVEEIFRALPLREQALWE
jgi:tRNA-dihydrouridine synthase